MGTYDVSGASVVSGALSEIVLPAGEAANWLALAACREVWVLSSGAPTTRYTVDGQGVQTRGIRVIPAFGSAQGSIDVRFVDPALTNAPREIAARTLVEAENARNLLNDQSLALTIRTAGGTANALTFTASAGFGGISSYVQNRTRIRFMVTAANTGAVTLQIDTGPAGNLLKPPGTALVAGDLRLGEVYEATWTVVSGVNGGAAFWMLERAPFIAARLVNSNIGIGDNTFSANVTGDNNIALGPFALNSVTSGNWNIAIGAFSLTSVTSGGSNVSLGILALQSNTIGGDNIAIGATALRYNTTGSSNIALGGGVLANNTTGYWNIALGGSSLIGNTTGTNNTAIGILSLSANTTGANNVAIGTSALQGNTTGANNTAVGNSALVSGNRTNSTGIGYSAAVTGDNQVQLGDSATTTYVFGTVQNRSDARDKADVRDTALGLPFLMSLRPVDFRWDMREDYRPERPERPEELSEPLPVDATDEQKAAREAIEAAYRAEVASWAESARLANIAHDGSKKRRRYHTGLIAQEVAAAVTAAGFDPRGWGAIQDHAVSGGDAVMTLGYDQFVPVLIRAVQELSAQNAALEARIAAMESANG